MLKRCHAPHPGPGRRPFFICPRPTPSANESQWARQCLAWRVRVSRPPRAQADGPGKAVVQRATQRPARPCATCWISTSGWLYSTRLIVVEFNGGLCLMLERPASALRGTARGIDTRLQREPDRGAVSAAARPAARKRTPKARPRGAAAAAGAGLFVLAWVLSRHRPRRLACRSHKARPVPGGAGSDGL